MILKILAYCCAVQSKKSPRHQGMSLPVIGHTVSAGYPP